jgi:hypothetical protein
VRSVHDSELRAYADFAGKGELLVSEVREHATQHDGALGMTQFRGKCVAPKSVALELAQLRVALEEHVQHALDRRPSRARSRTLFMRSCASRAKCIMTDLRRKMARKSPRLPRTCIIASGFLAMMHAHWR